MRQSLFILTSAILMFLAFWRLLDLAIPEAALPFAIGITAIIMGGLLSGRYVSRYWLKLAPRSLKALITALSLLVVIGAMGVGALVNRMIDDTEFFHFLMTIMLLFFTAGCLGAVISLIRHGISTRLQEAHTAMTQSKSELQLLQSQLSPHFLFNTLNNLYGLSLTQDPKVPKLLLKLSELLRYSVYDTKELYVPLKQEIDYILNYLEFEKIRLDERLTLKSNLNTIEDEKWQIAPMMLIVFVENAFKHAKNAKGGKIVIEMNLALTPKKLHFLIRNSRDQSSAVEQSREKRAGFGLDSIKKRLELLYKHQHDLRIASSDDSFEVNLILTRS